MNINAPDLTVTEPIVLIQKRDGIGTITLNRPAVHNALNEPLRRELATALGELGADPEIGVLILTGAGSKAFSAGMDLREFASSPMTPLQMRRHRIDRPQPFATLDKPIIAAVNGMAIGGGLELVLLCDVVVASDAATFALAEVRRGIIPGNGGTQRLARRVGKGRATELILTGRSITASDALLFGLVEFVVSPDALIARAEDLARQILANAPVAVRCAKDAIRRGLDLSLAEGLGLENDLLTIVSSTLDAHEGPAAFADKRAPRWSGR